MGNLQIQLNIIQIVFTDRNLFKELSQNRHPSTEDPSKAVHFPKIVTLLENGRPVGISYNVTPIVYGEQFSQDIQHASIVVGYKKQGERILFKVRHVFGSDCIAPNGTEIPNCTDGYQYVEGIKLSSQIVGLTWLDKASAKQPL